MHLGGKGVPESESEYRRWLVAAADQQYCVAQNELGVRYQSGSHGFDKNLREAARCYLASAVGGGMYAEANLVAVLAQDKAADSEFLAAYAQLTGAPADLTRSRRSRARLHPPLSRIGFRATVYSMTHTYNYAIVQNPPAMNPKRAADTGVSKPIARPVAHDAKKGTPHDFKRAVCGRIIALANTAPHAMPPRPESAARAPADESTTYVDDMVNRKKQKWPSGGNRWKNQAGRWCATS